jgi:YesN/AraC family two-component response regulator
MAPDHRNYSGTECISSNGGYMDDLNSEGEPAHRSSDADSSKPTLLIVEDNDELRLMLRNELQEYFAIFESCDGEEGLVTAQEQMPDVILSDVMMPGLNGIELCDKLKRNPQTSHIPIVLLTAKVGEESELKGIRKGADDYISKPFNIKILYAKLLNHVQIRQKLKIRFSKETSLLPESLAQNNLDEQFIQKVVDIIKGNISENGLNADKIAGELNVSRSFLYEKIHALSGKTVNEFVRIIRLKAACELMENKNLTLSEIAYSVGFTSLNYFSKSFKKQFNYSPSEYIEKNLA